MVSEHNQSLVPYVTSDALHVKSWHHDRSMVAWSTFTARDRQDRAQLSLHTAIPQTHEVSCIGRASDQFCLLFFS